MSHVHHKVEFEGSNGLLSGSLQVPDGKPKGAVLLSHCFTCSKSLKVTREFATAIEAGGYAVLRFDFTGLGESEGDFGETSVSTNLEDIRRAARFLAARDLGPCALIGHSLGGAASLLAATDLPEVQAVVAIAAPAGPGHVERLFSDEDIEAALSQGRATVSIAGRRFEIGREFFEDLKTHSAERIAHLNRPLLVVHGPVDSVVPIQEGHKIFDLASHPKWFAAIPNADHLFLARGAVDRAAAVINCFLETFLR